MMDSQLVVNDQNVGRDVSGEALLDDGEVNITGDEDTKMYLAQKQVLCEGKLDEGKATLLHISVSQQMVIHQPSRDFFALREQDNHHIETIANNMAECVDPEFVTVRCLVENQAVAGKKTADITQDIETGASPIYVFVGYHRLMALRNSKQDAKIRLMIYDVSTVDLSSVAYICVRENGDLPAAMKPKKLDYMERALVVRTAMVQTFLKANKFFGKLVPEDALSGWKEEHSLQSRIVKYLQDSSKQKQDWFFDQLRRTCQLQLGLEGEKAKVNHDLMQMKTLAYLSLEAFNNVKIIYNLIKSNEMNGFKRIRSHTAIPNNFFTHLCGTRTIPDNKVLDFISSEAKNLAETETMTGGTQGTYKRWKTNHRVLAEGSTNETGKKASEEPRRGPKRSAITAEVETYTQESRRPAQKRPKLAPRKQTIAVKAASTSPVENSVSQPDLTTEIIEHNNRIFGIAGSDASQTQRVKKIRESYEHLSTDAKLKWLADTPDAAEYFSED